MLETITIHFIYPDKSVKCVQANVGETVLQVVRKNGIDIIEGACDGCLACSTCHVIVEKEWFVGVLAQKCEEEEDMLDLASHLEATSRLGCQIKLTREMDGLVLKIPGATRNFQG